MADPMYRQIAEDLREQIESGDLRPGAQLPTEIELREHYGNASRNTVRDAIKWLTTRGLVVTQPGRGTFVVETITPFIVRLHTPLESKTFEEAVRQQGREPSVSQPRVEVQNADADVARELQIEKGSTVVIRHQQRFIDHSPSSLQTSYYPMEFVQLGAVALIQATDIPTGASNYVADMLGIAQVGYRDRLLVRSPNAGEIRFFRLLNTGTELVVGTHRTAYGHGHKPIRYTVTVYPADRNHFVIDFDEVPPLEDLVKDL